MLPLIMKSDDSDKYQFGFKSSQSTTNCSRVLKKVVNYYVDRGSHVFACYADFSKAFDKVNYRTFVNFLLDNNVPVDNVSVLAFWYSHQEVYVRWQNIFSTTVCMSNDTRQGSSSSPYLFDRYIRDLILSISKSQIGCNIGGVFFNILAYADDLVLLTSSWHAMQKLIKLLHLQANMIVMVSNAKKTCCMVFNPRCKSKIVPCTLKNFELDNVELAYVSPFKYLGHILCNTMCDDSDIKRDIRNLHVRVNVLARRYSKCSHRVAILLFKSFCFYDIGLWEQYSATVYRSFNSCYHRCLKLYFKFRRRDSVTGMLLILGLPIFLTIVWNARCSVMSQ